MELDSVPEKLGDESLLGLNHIEFIVVAGGGDNLCLTRLIINVHP